jgi:bifunctional DNase/RNase
MLKEVVVSEVHFPDDERSVGVVLKEKDGERMMAIYVGHYEAQQMVLAMAGREAPRPLTHDLLLSVLSQLGGRLHGVAVTEIHDNTYYGNLIVRDPSGNPLRIDTRPSDGLVLALKEKVPIFVEEDLFPSLEEEGGEEESEGDDEEESIADEDDGGDEDDDE